MRSLVRSGWRREINRAVLFLVRLRRSLPYRKDICRLVSGLRSQVSNARMEVVGNPLPADADNDTLNFLILGDQPDSAGFFLDGYYFRSFGHDTKYADCSP